MYINVATQSVSNPSVIEEPVHEEHPTKKGRKTPYNRKLRKMYQKCQSLTKKKDQMCATCGIQSNLACCLDCDTVYCDGRGHLSRHLKDNPTHQTLYSFKLQRQIRCCKSTCEKTNIYKLLLCQDCLDSMFRRHYNMLTATWAKKGLQYIPNAVSCENHFQWHYTNCTHANGADFVVDKKKITK